MPKTPMHKDSSVKCCQHNVWLAGKIFTVQPETQAMAMQSTTDSLLWTGVAAGDFRHHLTACANINNISHICGVPHALQINL
ncbi:hypothetical protein OAE79_00045 [Rhodopirellula sp.]|nr:hypothetical protein [Rhodopirellula sp.]